MTATLREAWKESKVVSEVEKIMKQTGVDEGVARGLVEDLHGEMGAGGDEIKVEEKLKGLWKVEDTWWVIEGECPVSECLVGGMILVLGWVEGEIGMSRSRCGCSNEPG
jgi:hypothetical protein